MIKHKIIIFKTIVVGLVLSLPEILASIIYKPCEESFLLSPCAWVQGWIFLFVSLILYILSIVYMLHLYSKPKFYRALLIVVLSNFTLFVIYMSADFFESLRTIIFLQVIYPTAHLIYYFLFSVLVPKIESKV